MESKDPLPASISRYRILKRLGEGGMGSLYLARDPEMDRLLAIKLLREDVESDELRERFKHEARAHARLNHQNIVTVYDVGEDMDRPFIAMEYIEGNTISGVIRAREDMPLDRKLLLMEQLCDGLAYAHRAGIVHRDIKPANLMLDGRGALKILDFGIARIGHAAATGMTQAGTLMGTLNYMSPEQMTGRPVDHRTDIFAVGAVVYEFLAYQRAFPGDIQDGVLHRIIHEPPPPLDKFVPGIDDAVVAIVAKALEKDRENRYQDLDQMRQDIAKYRARQMLKDDRAPSGSVTHGGGTVVVRPSSSGASGLNQLTGNTPAAVTDPKKAELLRKKAKQIEKLLAEARSTLDGGDTESVFAKCESVLMLDPDNMLAVELSEKAQTISERAKQQTLLADARVALGRFDFTKALQLVGEALVIDPTSVDALAVRKEIDPARKRKQQQDRLAQELKARIEETRKLVAEQQYEKALQEADAALELDARNAEAMALKRRATAVVEERRATEEAARLAKARDEQRKQEEAERKRQKEKEARRLKAQQDEARRRHPK
jgi:eukaryotic-like serine/threonine-protein kinase